MNGLCPSVGDMVFVTFLIADTSRNLSSRHLAASSVLKSFNDFAVDHRLIEPQVFVPGCWKFAS